MAFDKLPEILRMQGVQNILKSASADVDVFDRIVQRSIGSGIVADSYKRIGATPLHPAFQASPMQVAANPVESGILGLGKGLAKGRGVTHMEQLEEEPTQKIDAGGNVRNKVMEHTDPLRTHEEILKRIPPPRTKTIEPDAPMKEYSDADLKRLGLK